MDQVTLEADVKAETKPWWKSRTLWFNAFVAALAAAEATASALQPVLSERVYGTMVFALVVGNAVLRVATSKGLSL